MTEIPLQHNSRPTPWDTAASAIARPATRVGGRVAAFFDVDGTLVRKNTAGLFARHMYREGHATLGEMLSGLWWVGLNKFNVLDIDELMSNVVSRMKGQSALQTAQFSERWIIEVVLEHVSPEAIKHIENHRLLGHDVVILSASSQYICEPIARHLRIEHVLCTRIEEGPEGQLTGGYVAPLCYGLGKIHWAKHWAAENNVALGESYFYTDSYSDLPMLLEVGHPRVVNPDPQLRAFSRRRSWPVEKF